MSRTVPTETAIGTDLLITQYLGVICDLDGVVYRGATAVPGAVETLDQVLAEDIPIVFATNNASRPPAAVREHLGGLGIGRHGWSVVTSSQAAATYLAERLPQQTPVYAVGGPGVAHALTDVGLVPVGVWQLAGTRIPAVVQGLGIDVTWRELAEVGYLVQGGAIWVATNLDPMLPTSRGPAPGNGALVAAVQATTAVRPHVVGKPGAALFDLARATLGTPHAETLVCGDRLDTDIAGANAAGLDSLLVLSGAARLRDVAFAAPAERPTFLASDLTGLLAPGLRLDGAADELVEVTGDAGIRIRGGGDRSRLLRSVVMAAWAALSAGRALSDDARMWRRLEDRLGIGSASSESAS